MPRLHLIAITILALTLSACGGVDYGGGSFRDRGRAPSVVVQGITYGSAYEGYLNFSDVSYMSEAFLVAMRADEGTTRSWSNGRSGTGGEVIGGTAYLENVDYARGRRLGAPVGLMTDWALAPAQGDYRVTANTNVRLGASTSSPIATTLPEGSVVEAVGEVRDGPWMMVARHGEVIGYMHTDFLEQRDGGDVLLAGGAAREPVYCREFEQRLSLRGGARDRWTGSACRGARGDWQVQGPRGIGT